jgi:2-dehydro-3-deoxygluconokinase
VTKAGSDATSLVVRAKDECKWDEVSLGEVMLRLDPGDVRVATARWRTILWVGCSKI